MSMQSLLDALCDADPHVFQCCDCMDLVRGKAYSERGHYTTYFCGRLDNRPLWRDEVGGSINNSSQDCLGAAPVDCPYREEMQPDYSLKEVAARLGVSLPKVMRLIALKKLGCYRLGRSSRARIRITPKQLADFESLPGSTTP